MNFLAHLSLSGTDPRVLVGNFIGDFVKGRAMLKTFDPGIVKGIELHRGIDFFTDSHSVVMESKRRLQPKYHHYAGVIVDMFYDHFLAANWKTYYLEDLQEFARRAYRLIEEHDSVLPEPVKRLLPYIIQGNWLVSYSSTEGIHRALSGMARRTLHESGMNEAVVDLKLFYEDFKSEFERFFPDLQQWASDWLAGHSSL